MPANDTTLHFVRQAFANVQTPLTFAEIGVDKGDTSLELARYLNGRGTLHLFDFEDVALRVRDRLAAQGLENVVVHGCSRCSHDSYNWNLMRLLRDTPELRFDYVYLDGAHTWEIDGLAFFLCDMLLRPNGFIDFDDYHWSHAASPTCNPESFPGITRMYTAEQIATPQVALVVDLLVRRSGRYREVLRDKVFMRTA